MHKRKKNREPEMAAKADKTGNVLLEGNKKWVRYNEGAVLYSMGVHSFMELAKEAKAVYRIRRICLVNTEKLDEYIELMYGEELE